MFCNECTRVLLDATSQTHCAKTRQTSTNGLLSLPMLQCTRRCPRRSQPMSLSPHGMDNVVQATSTASYVVEHGKSDQGTHVAKSASGESCFTAAAGDCSTIFAGSALLCSSGMVLVLGGPIEIVVVGVTLPEKKDL
mmetsp:Transcript_9554/g.15870  ORF Transcript_9554/g.15870 Transcript_9554/m.15870 type:complete len:137 (+) Transcript_9554:62-472(+)